MRNGTFSQDKCSALPENVTEGETAYRRNCMAVEVETVFNKSPRHAGSGRNRKRKGGSKSTVYEVIFSRTGSKSEKRSNVNLCGRNRRNCGVPVFIGYERMKMTDNDVRYRTKTKGDTSTFLYRARETRFRVNCHFVFFHMF